MAWTETITGVQQRVITGFDIDLVSAMTMGLAEISPYVFLSQHMYSPHLAVASIDWWESMSDEDRALFQQMFDLLSSKSTEYARNADREAIENLKAKGHILTPILPEERASWIKDSAEVYKAVPQIPAELVEEIRAELKKLGKI